MNPSIVKRTTDSYIKGVKYSGPVTASIESGLPDGLSDVTREAMSKENYALTGCTKRNTSERLNEFRIATTDRDGKRIEFFLLITPSSLSHGKSNLTYSLYSRSGFIVQTWGPGQDTLNSDGKTAAFMVPGVGLSNLLRNRSLSFLNMMALVAAYRNNGYEFIDQLKSVEITRVINMVNDVEIFYDGQSFLGHFQNFSLDEDGEHPYSMNYNFEFIISSNNEARNNVWGHYKPLPLGRQDINTNSTLLSSLSDGNFMPPAPQNPYEESLSNIWKSITGTEWDQAYYMGYTRGSPRDNQEIQGNLLRAMSEGKKGIEALNIMNRKYPPQLNEPDYTPIG